MILLQTALTSLDGLSKFIDLGQLTSDLGGSFNYDHSKWINMRMVSQEILLRVQDYMLDNYSNVKPRYLELSYLKPIPLAFVFQSLTIGHLELPAISNCFSFPLSVSDSGIQL